MRILDGIQEEYHNLFKYLSTVSLLDSGCSENMEEVKISKGLYQSNNTNSFQEYKNIPSANQSDNEEIGQDQNIDQDNNQENSQDSDHESDQDTNQENDQDTNVHSNQDKTTSVITNSGKAIDRSNFNAISERSMQKLKQAILIVEKEIIQQKKFVVVIHPSIHLVESAWKQFTSYVTLRGLFYRRSRLTQEEISSWSAYPKLTRKCHYYVAVSVVRGFLPKAIEDIRKINSMPKVHSNQTVIEFTQSLLNIVTPQTMHVSKVALDSPQQPVKRKLSELNEEADLQINFDKRNI